MASTSRRAFLTGIGSALIASPAIVRATSLMPVKAFIAKGPIISPFSTNIYAELTDIARKAFVPRLIVNIYDTHPITSQLKGEIIAVAG